MTILELIEKMAKTGNVAQRRALLKAHYHKSAPFRRYMHMIYGEYPEKQIKKLPKFTADANVANGLHYTNLERNVKTLERIFFDPAFGPRRENVLIQILENVAPEERDVIKAILQNKWKYCTPKYYSEELIENAG